MAQANQLISTLKRQLKAQGVTYLQIAQHLHLSEASVKRLFSKRSFSLQTLETICGLIDMELSDLVKAAEAVDSVSQLTESQELELVSDINSVLVSISVLNGLSFQRIIENYQLTEAECIVQLIRLERIGFIQLLPENKVKLKVSRDFSWLPGGPIHQFFRQHAQTDFLNSDFKQTGDFLRFQHAMISPAANLQFQQRLQRLIQEFADLHEGGIHAPDYTRFGTSLLIAMRPWEPKVFQELRRKPDSRFLSNARL